MFGPLDVMRQYMIGAMLGLLGLGWEQLLGWLWCVAPLSMTHLLFFAGLYAVLGAVVYGTLALVVDAMNIRWWMSWGTWAALLVWSKAWVWKWSVVTVLGFGLASALTGVLFLMGLEHLLFRRWPASQWPLRISAFLALSALFFVNLNVFGAVTEPDALWADAGILGAAVLAVVVLSLSPMGHWTRLQPKYLFIPTLLVGFGLGLGLFKQNAGAVLQPTAASGTPVVLIVVDTLRADHLGFMGYPHPTSPRLDAFAKEAISFENAQSAAPWTLPSFASILTGAVPSVHGAGINTGERNAESRLGADAPTLAELFSDAGYGTAAVVSNAYLKKGYGLHRGFQHYDDVVAMGRTPLLFQPISVVFGASWMGRPYRSASDMAAAANALIDAYGDRPFFLMLHFMDPHDPYFPHPDDVATLEDVPSMLRSYDAEIRGVDRAIGRVLDTLPKNAVVVVTSDHGEMFGEHEGAYSDWHPPRSRHGMNQYQELLHVPLMIRAPQHAPKRITRPVSLVDLAANLAPLADLSWTGNGEIWPDVYAGRVQTGQPAISESIRYGRERKAVRLGDWKAIYGPDRDELYYLPTDPGEHSDVGAQFPDVVEGLRIFVPHAAQHAPIPVQASQSEQEALRQLGYVDE